ncbi:MAG: hypothetical protein ACKV22_14455 [Bryobacteraceae bacterium]
MRAKLAIRLWLALGILAGGTAFRVPEASAETEAAFFIDTVAGGNFLGDGLPASSAQLSDAQGVAVDFAGNLYIADPGNHRVRRVSSSGIIDTVAGTGSPGFSGDGGPAGKAQLNLPYGIAVDGTGTLYIADFGNRRVRRVTADGVIRTIAGSGENGSGGDGRPATDAQLSAPRNVALDSQGNLYISDFAANRIRRVTVTGVMSTLAGTGVCGSDPEPVPAAQAQFCGPAGLVTDAAGALLVADSGGNRIRRVSAGAVSNVFGLAPDGAPLIFTPTGVALDTFGSLYIAEAGRRRVWRIEPGGGVRQIAGADSSGALRSLDAARDVAVDSLGAVYIADGRRIRRLAADGTAGTVAGDGTFGFRGDGAPALQSQLNQPSGVAVGADGSIYIADELNHRVRRVAPSGIISTVAGTGSPGFGLDGRTPTETPIASPTGVTIDPGGSLWFAERTGHRVRRITSGGIMITAAGTGSAGVDPDDRPAGTSRLSTPAFAVVDPKGDLYIADTENHRVRRVGAAGTLVTVAGNGNQGYSGDNIAAADAQLNRPSALAFDAAGLLYIADSGNNRIRRVGADGKIVTVVGEVLPLSTPSGLVFGPDGTLYVADSGNHRVLAMNSRSELRVIAGTAASGFAGDGGPALEASLAFPTALAVDSTGALLVADQRNHRIRKLTLKKVDTPPPPITTDPLLLSLVNTASREPGAVAPGQLLTVQGDKIGTAQFVAGSFNSQGILSDKVADLQVLFDGKAAPIFSTLENSINVQAPYSIAGKIQAKIEVRRKDQAIGSATADVVRSAPGIFTVDGTGTGAAIAQNHDGMLNTALTPAVRGLFVSFFATGEGLINPTGIDGQQASAPLSQPVLPVSVSIGGRPAEVLYAGSAPGMVGVLQVNARVAADLPSGALPLVIVIGTAASQQGVTIQVR